MCQLLTPRINKAQKHQQYAKVSIMSESTDTFTFKGESPSASPSKAQKHDGERHNFITPFIVLAFLALPSLAVIAATKQTAGYDLLIFMGYYQLVQALFWVLVPAATICAVLYLIRSRSKSGRVGVSLITVALLAAFVYVIWPQA